MRVFIIIAILVLAVPVCAEILFQDDFEYQVDRDDPGDADDFADVGPWDAVKAENAADGGSGQQGGAGYLYTVTSISGFSGSFPGTNSTRVLCMEGLAETFGYQTDFYLHIGGSTPNEIPGDVWFQFWIYINYHGDELSQIPARFKFLYPSNDGYGSNSDKWLWWIGANSHEPDNEWAPTSGIGNPSEGHAFIFIRDHKSGNPYYTEYTAGPEKIGQTDTSEYIVRNTWYLVKIHFDTSVSSGCKYEAWLTPQGGETTKVAEWIGGVTPNFTWTQTSPGGHETLRMPTTWPGQDTASERTDAWVYMDDFVMAENESDLPTYATDVRGSSKISLSGAILGQ